MLLDHDALDFLHPVKTLPKAIEGVYLGLDPSESNFGVAVLESNKLYAGTFQPNEQPYPARLHHIECVVRGLATILRPKRVAIEGYSFGSKFGVARSGATGGVARLGLLRAQSPFVEIPPTTLKMFATGGGKGKKNMLMLATGAAGMDIQSDDEADACWLCLIAAAIDGQFGSAKQQEVARKAAAPKEKKPKGRKNGNPSS